MSVVLPSFTRHFATLAGDYDVVLCDVWGVVHNGVAAAADAGDALARFRARGGTVVLITNAPPRSRKRASASPASAAAATPLWTTPQTSHSTTS